MEQMRARMQTRNKQSNQLLLRKVIIKYKMLLKVGVNVDVTMFCNIITIPNVITF